MQIGERVGRILLWLFYSLFPSQGLTVIGIFCFPPLALVSVLYFGVVGLTLFIAMIVED